MPAPTTPDQLLAQQKANVETLFNLTGKVFDGMEKLVALNLQAAKATLGEASEATRAALSATDAQQLLALQQGLLQPAAEKAAAYARQLYEIATGVGSELSKAAETQAADLHRQVASAVDAALGQLPQLPGLPGDNGGAAALVKSALATAEQMYAGVQQATQQATQLMEANAQSVAASITPAATPAKAKR